MENVNITTLLAGTGSTGTIIFFLYIFYKTFNKKHFRSKCCDSTVDIEMELSELTPTEERHQRNITVQTEHFTVQNPMRPPKD